MAGWSNSINGDVMQVPGEVDYWIVKLNDTGAIQWKGLFGGNRLEYAYSIQQTFDNGYIVAGWSNSTDVDGDVTGVHGSEDYWIVKLNDSGIIQWQKSLGGSREDMATSIRQTRDSGYIVAGLSISSDGDVTGIRGSIDYWIVKLNDTGAIEWQRSLGGSDGDAAHSIQQTKDGGYIVAGFSHSTDGDITVDFGDRYFDYWVVKLSDTGAIEWQRSLGGSRHDKAYSIQQTIDGGYIVAGCSESIDYDVTGNHGEVDYWIVKLNATGVLEWERSLGGSKDDIAFSIHQTKDRGYIVAGESYSNDGDVTAHIGIEHFCDFWVVKLNDTGAILWEKSLGGASFDYAKCIQQTEDGGYIVAGVTTSNDGDVTGHHGGEISDFWIVKLSPEVVNSVESESAMTRTASITPNPASSSATLTLESDEDGVCEVQIISVTGATLKEYSTHLSIGKQDIALTGLESLPSGMYEVSVKQGYKTLQTKLILQR